MFSQQILIDTHGRNRTLISKDCGWTLYPRLVLKQVCLLVLRSVTHTHTHTGKRHAQKQ